jgi:PAS domain S-box-containing protein
MNEQNGVLNVKTFAGETDQLNLPDLLNSIPASIAYVDNTLHYRYVNAAYEKLTGIASDDLIGKTVAAVFGEDTFRKIEAYIDRVFSGKKASFELPFDDERQLRFLDVTCTPAFDAGGNVKGFTVHINDCTERKRTEIELKDYVENAAVGLHWVDGEGMVVWANNAELEMLGYSKEEYIGRHISEFHADKAAIADILYRLSCNEVINQYEAVLKCKDGSLRHVLISSSAFMQDGKFIHTRCFTLDVTEKRLAEEKLRESHTYYQQLIEDLPVAVYTCDERGYIRFYNKAAVDLWGREPQLGKDVWCGSWRIVTADGQPVSLPECPMAVAVKEARAVYGAELRIERPDGTHRFITPYPKPLFDKKGKVLGAVNALVDLTEQKHAQLALRESESRYQQLIDSLPVAVYTCDAAGRILLFNKASADLWGREPEIGKDLWCGSWKIFTPEGTPLPLDTCPMAIALKEGHAVHGKEIVVERPDGVRRNVAPHPFPLFNDSGKIIGAVNLLMDITDQKLAMRALLESEERFRTVASQAPVVIWMSDQQGNFTYLNSKWTELTGKDLRHGVGKGWLGFIHPEDMSKTVTEWSQAFSAKKIFDSKFRYRNQQSEYVIMKANGSPRFGGAGAKEFVGYIGIMQDITLHENAKLELEHEIKKRTQDLLIKNEELCKSEERYHRMITEVQDYAIILLDRDGKIENWNYGAEKIKGYSAKEAIGRNFRMFYTSVDQAEKLPEKLLNDATQNGKALHEGWRVRKDGTLFWGSIVLTALHDDQKQVIGFSKVTRDLTEKKAAEDSLKANALKLEEKNKELEKMNQELASFAYISSHDLQEPLRKIQTFSTRILELEDKNFSEKGKDYFIRMQSSAQRMRSLIEDLLAYSRANTAERKFLLTDLNQVLNDVFTELKEVIESKNAVVLRFNLPKAHVIPFQFHQLIVNILSNALKFTRTGVAPVITIRSGVVSGSQISSVSVDPKKQYHHISIADNGIGFDPSYGTKIFEIFQRLHNRKEFDGTGVGLAICKKIAENHGGAICAEGEVNKGAVFHIYIPA